MSAPMQSRERAGSASLRKGERATTLRYKMMALARSRENVISLGRGDPDLHTQPAIVEDGLARFAGAMGAGMAGWDEGPVRGLHSLREGIARRYAREKGVEVDPATEIAITNGAQEGLFLAMLALVNPGDRVACQRSALQLLRPGDRDRGRRHRPRPHRWRPALRTRGRRAPRTRTGMQTPGLRQSLEPDRRLRRP